ncbi:hypothetical protein [Ottowia sp.]|jgi:hypothetical protein|uniref:hypothetical protein n=1 Tax=Ottowia sp. TaxID=1898956 RepID=UPI0025F6EB43|nr:hypothetical protein [Ottowia sp.]MBK6614680.1 hypothetical protein [Ottowia sp.]
MAMQGCESLIAAVISASPWRIAGCMDWQHGAVSGGQEVGEMGRIQIRSPCPAGGTTAMDFSGQIGIEPA